MGHKRKRQALEATAASPPAKKHNSSSITKPPVASITLERFQDEPDRVQLKREADLYYDKLSSENPDVREEAEKAIVFGFGLLEEDGVSEATLLRHLDRRLFGGLASSRNCARLGCSIVVTEILAQLFRQTSVRSPRYASISMGRLLGILKAKVKPEGDLSGQEERDHYLGLLFGLQCFVKAEVLFGKEDKTWQEIFKQLIELAKKKPWVKRQCGQAIVDALAQMDLNTAEKALDLIQSEGFAFSPEGVAIWLEARRHFPEMKFPSKPWGTSGNPLEHLTDLAKALKESSSVADEKRSDKVQQTGTWNPQPHFAWDLVFDQYIQDANNDKDDAQTLFDNFWKKTVDGRNCCKRITLEANNSQTVYSPTMPLPSGNSGALLSFRAFSEKLQPFHVFSPQYSVQILSALLLIMHPKRTAFSTEQLPNRSRLWLRSQKNILKPFL